MMRDKERQILFVVEGDKAEHDLIPTAMKAFGIDTTQFATLLFRTNIHILLKEIMGENQEFKDDFESIDMKELLAGMLESNKGSIDRIDYHGVAEHTAGDPDWLRTAPIFSSNSTMASLYDFTSRLPKRTNMWSIRFF